MQPEAPSEQADPWETPPIELDRELLETSQRLVSLSQSLYIDRPVEPSAALDPAPADPRVARLESRNKYLFNRNIELATKVAALEAANLRLQAQISAFKQSQRSEGPWYRRWLKSP
jgi:hypothetical protein